MSWTGSWTGLIRVSASVRWRPVASGVLPVPVALVVAGVLLLAGVGVAAVQGTPLLVVLVTYLALTLSYALVLKRLVWLELAVVAVGFVLRALAGALAAGVVVSTSFLLVVTSAAVLVNGPVSSLRARSIPARSGRCCAGTDRVTCGWRAASRRLCWSCPTWPGPCPGRLGWAVRWRC